MVIPRKTKSKLKTDLTRFGELRFAGRTLAVIQTTDTKLAVYSTETETNFSMCTNSILAARWGRKHKGSSIKCVNPARLEILAGAGKSAGERGKGAP